MNLSLSQLIVTLLVTFSLQASFAKDIIFKSSEARLNAIKNGRVWTAPSWINSSFQFSDSLDVYNGPAVDGLQLLLMKDEVSCITTQKDQENGFGGKTPKFYCRLADVSNPSQPQIMLDSNGQDLKLKVKYSAGSKLNNEVYGEILGTRLLWALGFGADRMFFVNKTNCYGCSEDPYKTRQVEASTLNKPVSFNMTAIEIKHPGSKMIMVKENKNAQQGEPAVEEVEGWLFKELMANLPSDPAQRNEQFIHRDGLRLFAAFVHHLDLKQENQRIICPSEPDANGNCPVQPILMLQDVGSVFGTKVAGFHLDRVNLKTWKEMPVWMDGSKCQTNLHRSFLKDSSMKDVVISEAGRRFMSQLLSGFSEGEAGRRRVEALFQAARVDTRGRQEDSIAAWRDVFLDKVKQIKYPMGESNPNFVCPK